MRQVGADIRRTVVQLARGSEQARINLRAQEVREHFKGALESVYHEGARLFLEHTNNVYILMKDGVRTLIVYVDEGIFAAELNAQRELIKLKLMELFSESVEEFEIHVSRRSYLDNHPYAAECRQNAGENAASVPLDDDEKRRVSSTVSIIEDEKLRNAVKKAMTADLQWKKGKSAEFLV